MRLKRARQPAVRPWFSPFDVVDDGGAGPGQQRRDDEAHALAGPGGRETQDVLGPLVPDVGLAELAEQQAVLPEQPGGADLPLGRPPGGAVGLRMLGFPGAPHRHGDRHDDRREPARRGDVGAGLEDMRRIGVIREPPPEEGGRMIDRVAAGHEPRVAELGLIAELRGRPLRRGPDEGQRDRTDGEDLAPEDAGSVHGDSVVATEHD